MDNEISELMWMISLAKRQRVALDEEVLNKKCEMKFLRKEGKRMMAHTYTLAIELSTIMTRDTTMEYSIVYTGRQTRMLSPSKSDAIFGT